MLLADTFLDMRNECGRAKELDQFDTYTQSEADRWRSLGNSRGVSNREPHNPRLHHAATLSLRPDPRSQTLWMERHCCLHGHHSHRQQHSGKQQHPDRLSVRALLLHRLARTQGGPRTLLHLSILHLLRLSSLGLLDHPCRRSPTKINHPHYSRGLTSRVVRNG